jgi:uncharacterized protein (TIRG00374 family)
MRKFKIIIGLLLSAFFLWLAFLKVNFKELIFALESVNYPLIIAAAFLNGFTFIPRAYRWKLLLKPLKNTNFGSTFGSLSIGFMANSVLPARGGEFVRAFTIGQTEKISKSASFATILVERVFDLITLILFLVISLRFVLNNAIASKIFWVGVVLTISVIVFLVVLKKKPETINIIVFLSPKRFKGKIKKFLEAFIKGLEILSSFKILFYSFLQSLFLWSCFAMVYYILFASFGFSLSFGSAFLVMAICSIGISIPSSPGFIGTYHYFVVFSLSLFQIPKSNALSFAIVAWAVNFLPVVIIGLVALNKLGLSLMVKK